MNHTTALQLAFYGLTKAAGGLNTNKMIIDGVGNAASGISSAVKGAPAAVSNWWGGLHDNKGNLNTNQALSKWWSGSGKPAPASPAAPTAVAQSKPSLPTMPKNTLGGGSPLTLNPAQSAPQTLPKMPASPSPIAAKPNTESQSFKNVAPPEMKLDPSQRSTPPLSRSDMLASGPVDHSKDITAPSSGVSIAKGNPSQMIPASAPNNSAITGMKNSPGGSPITPGALKAAPAAPVGGMPPKPAAPAVKPMARPMAAPAARPATPPPVQNSRMGGLLGSMSNLAGRIGDSAQNAVGGANAKAQNMRTTSMIPGQGMKRASNMTHTTALQLALTKVAWAPSDLVTPFTEAAKSFKPLSEDQAPVTALLGGAAGAGIGALTGMGRDEKGKTHKLRNAILGLLAGTGAGVAGVGLGRGLINQSMRNRIGGHTPDGSHVRLFDRFADAAGQQVANHSTAGDLLNMAQQGLPKNLHGIMQH